MFSICEESEVAMNDEIVICGEICSPSELDRGKIYIGGLMGVVSKNSNESVRKSKIFRSPSEKNFDCDLRFGEMIRRTQFWSCDNEECSFESDMHSLDACPQCDGLLNLEKDGKDTLMPPYCERCKSYFVADMTSDPEMLDNLVDSLVQNNLNRPLKGSIVFLANQYHEYTIHEYQENNHSATTLNRKGDIYPIWSVEEEEEDPCILLNRITTDEEQSKILCDIKKTQNIAKRTIQKKISDGGYALAKDINGGESKHLRCVTCRMPLMEKNGKGTVCVTCPKIRSRARRNARNKRLEEKEALSKIDFIHTDKVNHNASSLENHKDYVLESLMSKQEKRDFSVFQCDQGNKELRDHELERMKDIYIERVKVTLQPEMNTDPNDVLNQNVVQENQSSKDSIAKEITECERNDIASKHQEWRDDKYCIESSNNAIHSNKPNEDRGGNGEEIPTVSLVASEDSNECRINWFQNRSSSNLLGSDDERKGENKIQSATVPENNVLDKSTVSASDGNDEVHEIDLMTKSEEESSKSKPVLPDNDHDNNPKFRIDDIEKGAGEYDRSLESESLGESSSVAFDDTDDNVGMKEVGSVCRINNKGSKVEDDVKAKINQQYERDFYTWSAMRKPLYEVLREYKTSSSVVSKVAAKVPPGEQNGKLPQVSKRVKEDVHPSNEIDPKNLMRVLDHIQQQSFKSQHRFDSGGVESSELKPEVFLSEQTHRDTNCDEEYNIKHGSKPNIVESSNPKGATMISSSDYHKFGLKSIREIESKINRKARPVPDGFKSHTLASRDRNRKLPKGVPLNMKKHVSINNTMPTPLDSNIFREVNHREILKDSYNRESEFCTREDNIEDIETDPCKIDNVIDRGITAKEVYEGSNVFGGRYLDSYTSSRRLNQDAKNGCTGEDSHEGINVHSLNRGEEYNRMQPGYRSKLIQPTYTQTGINNNVCDLSTGSFESSVQNIHDDQIIRSETTIQDKILDMQQYLQKNCHHTFNGVNKHTMPGTQQDVYPRNESSPIAQAFTFSTWSSSEESVDNKSNTSREYNKLMLLEVQDDRDSKGAKNQNIPQNQVDEVESLSDIRKQILNMKDIIQNHGYSLQKDDDNDVEIYIDSILNQFDNALTETEEISKLIASQDT